MVNGTRRESNRLQDDIGNHDNIDSWLQAHPQCDEETLREYWNEFQYDKQIYYSVV